MATPRRLLGRSPITQYVTLEGLELLTGVASEDFDLLVLKELVDNALDACDETARSPVIEISVEKAGNLLRLAVKDNAFGVDAEGIKKITDFSRLYSSRFHYKYPTRGALGNAWKYVLGMTYALASATEITYDEPPVTIISRGKRYDIEIQYENGDVSAKVATSRIIPETENKSPTGTTVIVSLPVYSNDWLKSNRYLHLVEGFAYFNPQAEIVFEDVEGNTWRYPPLKDSSGLKKLRESLQWFSQDEFRERVETEIREHSRHGGHHPLPAFIKGFRGLSGDKAIRSVLDQLGTDMHFLEDLEGKPEVIAKLYHSMRGECEPPSASVLEAIGDAMLLNRIAQIDGVVGADDYRWGRYSRYKCKKAIYEHYVGKTSVSVPFIVEVAVAANEQNGRLIHVGVNRSPKLEDPFGRYVFEFKKGEEKVAGVRGILEKNGIKADDPVTVLVHITCPNIQYRDPGKIHMDVHPFFYAVQDVVDKASKFYRQARRRIAVLTRGSYVPETTKEAVFDVLPQAIEFVSSGGKFRYKQRQLWYVVRAIFDQKGLSEYSPTYDYFANKLIPQAKEETDIGLSGLLKEANAELHEPRSESAIPLSTEGVESYEIPERKYNKILYVEKRGFKDVIVANRFHDRYDVAVIGAQGESSEDARKLLKRIDQIALKKEREGEKIDILCVHDADIWGHDIALTLSHASQRMWSHSLNVIDLGLTVTEAIRLGLKPERVVHKKPKRIPKKLLQHLPKQELLLLTGKRETSELYQPLKESFRVELNALRPEQFMEWLTQKLEDHGIKRKVRPPDDMIARETKKKIDESLEEHVRDVIFELCGGQEVVEELKASIMSLEGLEDLDVSQKMDQSLETYPTDGWNDIIKREVDAHVAEALENDRARERIREAILDRLRSEKTDENGGS